MSQGHFLAIVKDPFDWTHIDLDAIFDFKSCALAY